VWHLQNKCQIIEISDNRNVTKLAKLLIFVFFYKIT